MRIAMLTNNYRPYVAGVPISIEHLAEALRKRGNEVYVFAPTYDGQEEEEYVIRYPSFPIKIAGAPAPNILTGIFLQKIKELNIDIIHVHHPAITGNVALSLRRKIGIPVVFTYHTRYEAYLHYIKPLQKFEEHTGFIEWYLKYFCNRCDMIVAPTPGIRSYLLEREVDAPIGIMPTGIPRGNFEPDMERVKELRKRYRKDADYLFCTVSRLAKEKNLSFQLKGLQRLKQMLIEQGKTFRHLMIGDGPEQKNLMAEIQSLGLGENVILLGNVKNAEIKNYQAASDLFLFTSKSETQGIVLLEAMAVGNPVVAVEASGVQDIVEHGINGYLTPEDAGAWAAEIAGLLQNESLRRQMQEEAKRTAQLYSEEKVAELAESYYINTCVRFSKEKAPQKPFMDKVADKLSLSKRYMV